MFEKVTIAPTLSDQVAQALQPWSHQGAAAVAVVLKLPLRRNGVLVGLRILEQGRSLAADRLLFFLAVARNSRINGCDLVHGDPSVVGGRPAAVPAVGKLGPAWLGRSDPNGIEKSIARSG